MGLSPATDWRRLKDFFQDAGCAVAYSAVRVDAEGRSRCYGSVRFKSASDAHHALRAMRGAECDGFYPTLRVDRGHSVKTAWSGLGGDEDAGKHTEGEGAAAVAALLRDRDVHRSELDYGRADALRNDLLAKHRVQVDDLRRRWWLVDEARSDPRRDKRHG